jgi:GT2 family glycosyltransferase
MGNQTNLDKLLTPLYWETTEGATTMILNQGGSKIKVSRKATVYNSDENLGCAGGRKFLVDSLLADGLGRDDQLVFLDDDVEVLDRYWLWNLCSPLAGEYSISGVGGRRVTEDYLTVIDTRNPSYVSGGWCAIRADVFLDGTTWDLRFNPCYYEDIDLCYQIREKDKRLICVPDVGLKHEHEPNEAAAQLVAINRQKFIEKWGNKL